jgi:hypothetical protein
LFVQRRARIRRGERDVKHAALRHERGGLREPRRYRNERVARFV